jgi:hypothetical protein
MAVDLLSASRVWNQAWHWPRACGAGGFVDVVGRLGDSNLLLKAEAAGFSIRHSAFGVRHLSFLVL